MAGFMVSSVWSYEQGNVRTGHAGPDMGRPTATAKATATARAMRSGWPPVAVLPSIPTAAELSEMLGTPGDLEGVMYYADPPYENTTGYAADLPREAVVRAALDAAARGALVMVSEAVALPELVAAGWYAERIDHARRGAKRTFSKQQAEWVTMNRAPVHIAPKQAGLFG